MLHSSCKASFGSNNTPRTDCIVNPTFIRDIIVGQIQFIKWEDQDLHQSSVFT